MEEEMLNISDVTLCFVAESISAVTWGLEDTSSGPLSASYRELQAWGIFSTLWSGDTQCDARARYLSEG